MLDVEKLKQLYLMNHNEITTFFEIFTESMSQDLLNFENALREKDVQRINKISHKLKSGFKYVTVLEIALVFEQIQKMTESKADFSKILALYDHCRPTINELIVEINNFKNPSSKS